MGSRSKASREVKVEADKAARVTSRSEAEENLDGLQSMGVEDWPSHKECMEEGRRKERRRSADSTSGAAHLGMPRSRPGK